MLVARNSMGTRFRGYLDTYPGLRGMRFGFWAGFGRLLDLSGSSAVYTGYSLYSNPAEADAAAVASDWQAVGWDLLYAAETLRRNQPETVQPCKEKTGS